MQDPYFDDMVIEKVIWTMGNLIGETAVADEIMNQTDLLAFLNSVMEWT